MYFKTSDMFLDQVASHTWGKKKKTRLSDTSFSWEWDTLTLQDLTAEGYVMCSRVFDNTYHAKRSRCTSSDE